MWPDTESEVDYLNYSEVSQIAVDIISSDNMLPISIGIFGDWGVGKSSLLNLVKNKLLEHEENILIIKFDAWLFQGYDDARAALLETIANKLIEASEHDKGLVDKAKELLKRVNYFRLLGLAAEGAALASGVPAGGFLSKGFGWINGASDGVTGDELPQGVDILEEGADKVTGLLKPRIERTPPQQIQEFRNEYSELLKELGKKVVVIIDNLDRCLPKNTIHTLEAIRLFLFLPNTAFVIAADEDMIRGAVSEYFPGTNTRHHRDYIDKLIQVPIHVPKSGTREIRSYLFMLYAINLGVSSEKLEELRQVLEDSLLRSWQLDQIPKSELIDLLGGEASKEIELAFERVDRIAPMLAKSPLIQGNPRTVKRMLNVVMMRHGVALRRDMPIDEAVITKIVIFERCAGLSATLELYKLIDQEDGRPSIISELESGEVSDNDLPESWKTNTEIINFIKDWAQLSPQLSKYDLKPALYLSKETLPLSSRIQGMSEESQQIYRALLKVGTESSHQAIELVKRIPANESELVMQELIEHFRTINDWSAPPVGYFGAIVLSKTDQELSTALIKYFEALNNPKPWLVKAIKELKGE